MLKRARSAVSRQVSKVSALVFKDNEREYSVERVFAFHEYYQRTSFLRVMFVLSFNLSLPLLVLVGLDSVPIQEPRASWSCNWSFWMRTFVCALFVGGSVLVKASVVVPNVNITLKNDIMIVAGTGFVYTGSLMLLAKLWVFPVPFMYSLGSIPFCSGMMGFSVLVLGTKDRGQLRSFVMFMFNVGLETSMIFVCPTYNAIFLMLEGPAQLSLALLLPAIKYGFKYLITKVQSTDDDLIPGILSSVDIFNALYMTKCMQSAGTIVVGLAIIGIDLVHNIHAIIGLVHQTRALRAMYASEKRIDNSPSSLALGQHQPSALFSRIIQISKPQKVSVTPHPTPTSQLHALDQSRRRNLVMTPTKSLNGYRTTCRWAKIVPSEPPTAAEPSDQANQSAAPNASIPSSEPSLEAQIFIDSVQLLHQSEAVAVIEYIETVVPVFYALYISILFHMPNAKYYQDMKLLTAPKLHIVVLNILVYALMELVSLVWLHKMLKRSFGVSMLHLLAFTMERDWRLYQSQFVVWILIFFQFLLIRNGSDYSFEFKWIHGE